MICLNCGKEDQEQICDECFRWLMRAATYVGVISYVNIAAS